MADIPKIDTFIQSSPHPAWLATTEGHCVYANPALEGLTGFRSDRINQADWLSFLLEDDRAVASASWQRSLATGTPYRVQVRMRGSDDIPKCVELIAFGHKAGDDTELWLFTALDVKGIAAQKRPELEAQIQATLNVIPAYTWYALPSGALTFVNERTANYLGLPKGHPLRFGIDTSAEWDSHTALLHPDDREEARRVWSTCLSTGTAGEFTFRVPSAEGKYRWFLTRAEPLRANDGTLLYWIGVNLDIDDVKRAEDALRKSEKELRDVIDTIPAIVWSTLPDGSNTYVNKRFVEYSGSSAEQMAGSGWQALIHPDDLERHADKWREAVATGKPHESEVRSRRSDGQYRWQLDRGLPLRDEDGNIVKWYGVTTDIEDRKRAEEALAVLSRDLQESKSKLEEAQRITHVGYWEWDILTGRVNWSDETYRIYGMQPQERPMDIAACQERIYPEDWQRGMEEALGGGTRFNAECRVIRPTGEGRIAHFQGDVRRDETGRPYQMFGTVQDITDRKRAEEELRRSQFYLSEGQRLAHTGSWALNPSGCFEYWSQELFKIYGLHPQKGAPTLQEYLATVHPQDRDFMAETVRRMCEQGSGCDVKKRIIRPDGAVRYVRCVGIPVLDNGVLKRFLGTAMDVTEQEQLTQELQRREAYLAEAQRLSHTGSFGWKPDSGEIVWSDETYRIFEYDPALKPTIDSVIQRVHPDDRPLAQQVIDRASQTGTDFEHEYRLLLADGRVKHVHAIAHALQDASGSREFIGAVTDITERKTTEEQLRLSAQDLQRSEFYLAEGQRLGQTGSWALNPSGFFEYWSRELFQIYGLDSQKEAPTLEQYLATIHPQDRDFMAETVKRMCEQASGCDVKKRIIRPDGAVRYVRCVGIPVLDNGVLKRFLGTAMDVTEQELLTEELERQQAYLAEAQKLTHTGSWAWRGPHGSAVHLSDEFYRIFGFDPAEGAPTWEEVFERIHPEDRLKWMGTIERAVVEKADYDHEFRILFPNGKIKWIRSVGHPVLSDTGDSEQFVGSSTDITELKHTAEALRSSEAYLVEAQSLTHTGSCAIDGTSREAVYWSAEMFRLFGFDPQQGLPTFHQWLHRIHPEDRDKVKLASEGTFLTKVNCDVQFRVVTPDGIVKHIHGIGHPVLSATGELVQVLGTMVDVTESKRADEARARLRQLEADLAHTNRVSTLGEIAASLAHEIKQPIAAAITSANSCIEWLAHEPPNLDRARAAAARIDKYGNRAAEIIDRIRSFYKKSPPQRESVDVNGIIHEMLTLLEGEALRLSVATRTDLSAELPKIMVDPVQLQQVFMNLMLNGIEAMENSGGELTVKSQLQDGELQFSVSDTGVGLPTEKIDQIFSAFYTTKPQGSGMGLAISRSIVESHGGRLWATSNGRQGATFHFTLPTEAAEPTHHVA